MDNTRIINSKFTAVNRNIIVSLEDSRTALGNGIKVQEERGKKDILIGKIELADEALCIKKDTLAYFPMYAAVRISLNNDDRTYYAVNFQDVILLETSHE